MLRLCASTCSVLNVTLQRCAYSQDRLKCKDPFRLKIMSGLLSSQTRLEHCSKTTCQTKPTLTSVASVWHITFTSDASLYIRRWSGWVGGCRCHSQRGCQMADLSLRHTCGYFEGHLGIFPPDFVWRKTCLFFTRIRAISICNRGDQEMCFKPNHDVSPTRTKRSMCLNINRAEIQGCDKREIILQHKQL